MEDFQTLRPRSQGFSLLPLRRAGKREKPWERGCTIGEFNKANNYNNQLWASVVGQLKWNHLQLYVGQLIEHFIVL